MKRTRRSLHITNPAARELAEKLSRQFNLSLTEVVLQAMKEYAERRPKPIDRAKIDEICARIKALPVLDTRTDDEILGYDEFGLPR
ncbi:MAG: type II toxin-antitoxin system VapB family antitoxin [Acidobacteria bacterium]|nr:type II toxin-antitoxin system VapB family antitoxin [Acidobacteriota bacterium]